MNLKIEKYEKVAKSLYRLYLDNGEVIDVYDEVILENNLLLKKELSSYLYNKILCESKLCEFYNACIKYISIRVRSTKEIIDYLKKKGVMEEDITYVVNKLNKNKFLDDNYFCECFIKDKLKFTSMGEYKILYELKRLGISSDIINNNYYLLDSDILKERIDKIIDKKIRSNHKLDNNKLRNKIYNSLVNLGYSSNLVTERLNKYF